MIIILLFFIFKNRMRLIKKINKFKNSKLICIKYIRLNKFKKNICLFVYYNIFIFEIFILYNK